MTIAISNDFLLAFTNVQKSQQKQVREFIEHFREGPDAPGTNYEKVESARGQGLYSVRVNQAYRAIIFHPPGSDVYVLTWVDRHDEAYRWAESKRFQVNPLTGSLQVLNIDVEASVKTVEEKQPPKRAGLFDRIKDKHLLRLGVPEELLPSVRSMRSDGDLEAMEDKFPQEAYEALFMLASGFTLEEVFAEMDKRDEESRVDTADIAAALENEDSRRRFYVIDEARDLVELLNAPLEQWRVFLHPKQRRLVTMSANGPVRVLGGAGTGKTVVAMHRARYLAEEVFTGKDDRILFTTFTRNLATDIQENLRKICSTEALGRIEVVNLDGWVSNFLRTQGYRHQVVFDEVENDAWAHALASAPSEPSLSQGFYRSEWEQVIQAQNITTADQYLKVPRLGRGTRLSREVKQKIWIVFQEYRARLNEQGKKEFLDLIRDARGLIANRKIKLPYRSVIVDEAQDMSAEAFRLLRALVPEGPNDLFVVGDAHQRIYRYRATLGQCGINIRGRGKKLRINYRTTDEIRRYAVGLLEGRPIGDLDGGADEQRGYVSLTHGGKPEVMVFDSFAKETDFIREYLGRLKADGMPLESICVVTRTKKILEGYAANFVAAGLPVYEIKRNMAERRDKPGLRLATMHRVKGLEFEHVIVVSANEGIIPLEQAVREAEDAVARRNAETTERSLLYVALTRAKRSALITAWGNASPYVTETKRI